MQESSNASPSPTRQAVIAAYQNRDFCIARSFLAHLRSEIKRARLYAIWQGALAYFRRLRLLTVIARLIALLFSALQLGTTVLLTTVFLLILLPLLAVAVIATLLTAAVTSRQSNRFMLKRLHQKQVYVLFLPKEPHAFFLQNARALAAQNGCAVILISPFFLSGKGLDDKRFYFTVCNGGEQLYLVRRYYFFSLRRHVPELENARYLY